ncbi:hypothetical protein V6N11_058382 [Hibiscus sabdariffa]|uniref:Uncharacterized protein n=1 Tax=Hibiscus sabdariffa TaxID=183260 RepID=A0ABR2U4V2_9ROSI
MNVVFVRDQRHEPTPPRDRNIKSNQGRKLRRLRDKPVTQQDALPNSEVFLAEMFIDARPVVSTEASPLSSCKGRLSRHIHRQD